MYQVAVAVARRVATDVLLRGWGCVTRRSVGGPAAVSARVLRSWLQLRFDCNSTALWPRSTTYVTSLCVGCYTEA